MGTGLNLAQPLVIDRGAFDLPEGHEDLRTDLWAPFGDGEYRFRLGGREVRMIERRTPIVAASMPGIPGRFGGVGSPLGPSLAIGTVYGGLCRGRALFPSGAPVWAGLSAFDPGEATFSRDDVALVIGWGLVGGGEGVVDGKAIETSLEVARDLVRDFVDDAPISPNWTLAFAILGCALYGRAPDPKTGR